jgi:hypothetical protein
MTNKMKTIRLFRACYGKEVSHHHLHFKTQSQRNEKIHNGKKKREDLGCPLITGCWQKRTAGRITKSRASTFYLCLGVYI